MRSVTWTEQRAEGLRNQFVKLPGRIIHCSEAISGWVLASEERFYIVFRATYTFVEDDVTYTERAEEFYAGAGKIAPVMPRIVTGDEPLPYFPNGVWVVAR